MDETLFLKISNVKDVDGLADILKNTLPKLGYNPVPSPGVISLNRGIYNRTIHFESGNSGCYCKFDLSQGVYETSLHFKKFPETHYNMVVEKLSRKFPKFFLEYARR